MTTLQLIGNQAGRSVNIGSARLLNLYPHAMPDKTIALIGTPGLRSVYTSGSFGAIRGAATFGDYLVVVAANKLIVYDSAYAVKFQYTLHTSHGDVSMDNNGFYLLMVDGACGYLLNADATAVVEYNATDFFPTNPKTICFIDGFWVVSKERSGQFYCSNSPYSNDWDDERYFTAESCPDNIQRVMSSFGLLYLFGERSTEIWSSTGDDALWQRMNANVAQLGTPAPYSVVRVGETGGNLLWVASTGYGGGFAVMSQGGIEVRRITTPEVEYKWSKYTSLSNVMAYGYTQEGHVFYVVTFRGDNKTWVYDLTTDMWHERGGDDTRHRGEHYVFFNDSTLVSDFERHEFFKLDLDYFTDDGEDILREVITPTFGSEEARTTWHMVQVDMERGVGAFIDESTIMECLLTYSDDYGRSWQPERVLSFGDVGEYLKRVITWQLGRSFRRTFRIRIWNSVKIVLINLIAKVTQ